MATSVSRHLPRYTRPNEPCRCAQAGGHCVNVGLRVHLTKHSMHSMHPHTKASRGWLARRNFSCANPHVMCASQATQHRTFPTWRTSCSSSQATCNRRSPQICVPKCTGPHLSNLAHKLQLLPRDLEQAHRGRQPRGTAARTGGFHARQRLGRQPGGNEGEEGVAAQGMLAAECKVKGTRRVFCGSAVIAQHAFMPTNKR